MIGRKAIGNPWIFRDIIDYLSGKEIKEVTKKERLELIIKHINLEVEQKGERVGIKELRKHLAFYIKNMDDASKIRVKINSIETKKELIACLTEYFNI